MNINESQEEESLVVVDTNNQQQQQGSSHFGEGQQEVVEQSRPWSLQSSLSAASSDPAVRVLGTPISDISEDENQKPKMLVDAYGKRINEEEEEEEERASLRDFEEQERQIARQLAIEDEEEVGGGERKEVEEEESLENPQHQQQLPPQSPPIPTHARNLFPESLQNRQFNSSQILNDESCSNSIIEEDRQQHVRDVQRSPTISNRSSPVGGYPIDYSADPPPYTSSPPRVGGRLFVGNRLNTNLATVPVSERLSERENEESDEGTEHEEDHDEPEEDHEDEQESSGAYTVPSPSLTVEDGNKPPPPTLVNSSSSNFREALGNSVSMAGGVAAAVIASRGATISTASPRYQPDSTSASPRPVLIEGARTVASLVTSSNRIPSIPQPEYPQTSPREQQKREVFHLLN